MPVYEYVGPAEIRDSIPLEGGCRVRSTEDLDRFMASREPDERGELFTFVIDVSGDLRVAPRRSEHVACAGGGMVLAAGEIGFSPSPGRWAVTYASNQSTGYCPSPTSWPAVRRALEQAGIEPGSGFTHPVIFRRCTTCHEWNTVKELFFVCVFCDSDLPQQETR
ncbi:hypothetical protein [Streptomyces huasconensis]|uniref:hypothetical protein n=1 Tax=Streptomyces huasconensis TaxID=1854574 RepID=UPI0036F90B98